jgi:hypothetical protein
MGIIFKKRWKKYLSVPNFKESKDWLSEIAYEFQQIEEKVLIDLMLRGQRASPMCQKDVEGAISTAELLVSERIATCKSTINSLNQEISDLQQQLSKPLDLEYEKKEETSLSDKAILFWNKFMRDRKYGRKIDDNAQRSNQ